MKGSARIARDCKIYAAGELMIGNGTYINPNTLIIAMTQVVIGDYCAISWNCEIIDDDFHTIIGDERSTNKVSTNPITIGDHVWIGAGVRILKGVDIGNHAVIAAGSIVTKNVKNNTLVGGIPAKVIKRFINWE